MIDANTSVEKDTQDFLRSFQFNVQLIELDERIAEERIPYQF